MFFLLKIIIEGIASGSELMDIPVKRVNKGVIGLAVFELAIVINNEYSGYEDT
jgi:hypothetical protein